MANRHAALSARTTTGPRILAGRYAHIDAMRAFAVMLVVFQHSGLTVVPGPSGVTIFFVISGFVITNVLIRERVGSGGFSAKAFYVKRAFKLAPPFAVAILVPTLFMGPILKTFNVDWMAFLSQIFFAYNWLQVAVGGEPDNLLPGSQVAWSLAVEEQFYIAFALLWMLVVRCRNWLTGLQIIAAAGILAATIWRLWLVLGGAGDIRIARATDTRIDAIAWGVAAAVAIHLWQSGRLSWMQYFGKDRVLLMGGVLFIAGFAPLGSAYELTGRYTCHALSATLVILYGIIPSQSPLSKAFQSVSAWKLVNIIGLASYSIYLVHYVLIDAVSPYTRSLPRAVETGALLLLGVGAGILLWRAVERPAHKLQKKLGY